MDKFIFIERDGVVLVHQDTPVKSVEEIVFMPFAFEAFHTLEQSGIKPIILAMPDGLASGEVSIETVTMVHNEMMSAIIENEGRVHDIFVCPTPGIPLAKFNYPSSNLLRLAAAKYHIDLPNTFLITNRFEALQAGWDAGCKTVFVRSGKVYDAKRKLVNSDRLPDFNVRDLLSGVLKAADYYKKMK